MKIPTLIVVCGIALMSLMLTGCDEDSRKVTVDGNDIYYATSVTRAEAARIGKYLRDAHWIEDEGGVSLRLSKRDLDYEVRWQVGEDFFPFPDTVAYYRRMADSLSQRVFNGREVRIDLFDEDSYSSWIVEEQARETLSLGDGFLYYNAPATREEAEKVVDLLKTQPFFTEKKRVLLLNRYGREYNLRIALKDEWRSDRFLEDMAAWSSDINREIFPFAEFFMEACDPLFNTMEVVEAKPYANTFEMDRLDLVFTNDIEWQDISRFQTFIENCQNTGNCRFFDQAERIALEKKDQRVYIALPSREQLGDVGLQQAYKDLARKLSSLVFYNKPVTLRVYDPQTWEFILQSS